LRGAADEDQCNENKKDINISVSGSIYLYPDISFLLAGYIFLQK
jgi:hypothetical protein